MFLGEYTHSVDGKGRVVMPSRFRPELMDKVVVTMGRESQLVVYPSRTYEAEAAPVKQGTANRRGRLVARAIFGSADEQVLDTAGRLLVKPELREHAGLEPGGGVAVVGMFDNIEIWQLDRWVEEKQRAKEELARDEEEVAQT